MIDVILDTVAPTMAIAAIGFAYGRFRRFDLQSVTEWILYISAPCLVLSGLSRAAVDVGELAGMAAAVAMILAGSGGLAWLAARALGPERIPDWRTFVLVVAFPNGANLPLPLALLAFGQAGLSAQLLFYVMTAVFHLSFGVALLQDRGGWREALRMPLLPAALIGMALSATGTALPGPIQSVVDLLGPPAVPLMLFSLGYRLRTLRARRLLPTAIAAALRIGGGFAFGLAAVALLGLEGDLRRAVLLGCAMPTAVINFVLVQRYQRDSELAASTILVSTIAAIVMIPFLLDGLR